jgi:hypothetical protein
METSRLMFYMTIVLIGLCLSGCYEKSTTDGNQQHNTNNSFIGDWELVRSVSDYETWSFYTNGSARNIITQDFENQSTTTVLWYDYTKDNMSICFSTKDQSIGDPNYISICFSYSFSENSTRLTLSSNNIVIMDLVKTT